MRRKGEGQVIAQGVIRIGDRAPVRGDGDQVGEIIVGIARVRRARRRVGVGDPAQRIIGVEKLLVGAHSPRRQAAVSVIGEDLVVGPGIIPGARRVGVVDLGDPVEPVIGVERAIAIPSRITVNPLDLKCAPHRIHTEYRHK